MHRTLCCLGLTLALAWFPCDDPEPRSALDGEWEAVGSLDNRGDRWTEDDLKDEKFSCSIKGKKFVYRRNTKVREMTIVVNRKASPAEIDFVMPKREGTLEAIYSLEKGLLVICMNSSHWAADRAQDEPGRPKSYVPGDPANRGLNAVHTYTFRRKKAK